MSSVRSRVGGLGRWLRASRADVGDSSGSGEALRAGCGKASRRFVLWVLCWSLRPWPSVPVACSFPLPGAGDGEGEALDAAFVMNVVSTLRERRASTRFQYLRGQLFSHATRVVTATATYSVGEWAWRFCGAAASTPLFTITCSTSLRSVASDKYSHHRAWVWPVESCSAARVVGDANRAPVRLRTSKRATNREEQLGQRVR